MDNAEFSTHLNALAELIKRGDVELALERLLELRVVSSSSAQIDELITHLNADQTQEALALIERLRAPSTRADIASLSLDLMDELDDWLNLGDFSDTSSPNSNLNDSSMELVGSDEGFGDLGGLSQAELAQAPDENLLDMFEDISEPIQGPSLNMESEDSLDGHYPLDSISSPWSAAPLSEAPGDELELDDFGDLSDVDDLEELDLPADWGLEPLEPMVSAQAPTPQPAEVAPAAPARDEASDPSLMFEDFNWGASGSDEPLVNLEEESSPTQSPPLSTPSAFEGDASSSPFSHEHRLPQPESLHLSDLFEDDVDDEPAPAMAPISFMDTPQEQDQERSQPFAAAPQEQPLHIPPPVLDFFEDDDALDDQDLANLSSVAEPEEDVSFILESIASLDEISAPRVEAAQAPELFIEGLEGAEAAQEGEQALTQEEVAPAALPIPATYNQSDADEDRLTVDWDDWDRDISLAHVDDPDLPQSSSSASSPVDVADDEQELISHEDDDDELVLAPANVLGQNQPEVLNFQAPNWAEVFSEPVSISEPVDLHSAPAPMSAGSNELEELDALFDLEFSSDPDDAASKSQVPSFSINDDDDLFPGDFSIEPMSPEEQERFETTQLSAGAFADPHGDVTSLAPSWGKSESPLPQIAESEPEPVAEQLPIASSYIGVESDGRQELSFDLDFDDLDDAPALSEASQGHAPWELDVLDGPASRPQVMTPQHERPTRQLDAVTAQTLERRYESLSQEAAEEEDDDELFAPLGSASRAPFDDVLAQEPSDEFDFELEPYTGHMGTVQRESPVFDSLPSHATEREPDAVQEQAQEPDEFDFDLSWEQPQVMTPAAHGVTRPFEGPQTPGNPGGASSAPLHSFDRQKTPPAGTLKPEVLRHLAHTAEHKGVSGTVFGLPTGGFTAVRPQESAESLPEDEFFELAESLANEQSSAHLDRRRYRGEPMLRAEASSPGPFTRQHSEPEPAPVVRENPFAHEAPTGVREPLPESVKQSYSGGGVASARSEMSFELEEVPSRPEESQPFARKASAVLSGAPSALKRAQRAFEEGRLEQALTFVDEHLAHGSDAEGEAFRVKIIDEQERAQLRILGSLTKTPQLRVGLAELAQMNLDHRFGFVMSQIDGMMTFEDILDISHMPRIETVSLLVMMVEKGIISTS